MRCLALLAFISNLITSTSVTAHPLIEYSHQESRDFNLSDFYISGSPHSTITSYSFSTTDGKTSAQCYGSTATGPYISSLPNTCCGTTDCRWMFSFQLASNSSGYVLNVTNIPLTSNYGKTKKYIALKYYPSSAVRTYLNPFNPNGNYQYLESDRNFTMPYFLDCDSHVTPYL